MSRDCRRLRLAGVCVALCWATGPLLAADAPSSAASPSSEAPAATPAVLDHYLQGLKSLRMSFTQTVIDAQGRSVDKSTGELLVLRPGRFRWEVHPQGSSAGQLLIADGHNVWFYDRDLQQVTVKPMDAALSATPAMLLSGGVDLQRNFTLSSAGRREGLDWVKVQPRGSDADFRDALLGFAGNELERMILHDKLGQTATLSFTRSQRNAPVSVADVSFSPPAGVDVIGTPAGGTPNGSPPPPMQTGASNANPTATPAK